MKTLEHQIEEIRVFIDYYTLRAKYAQQKIQNAQKFLRCEVKDMEKIIQTFFKSLIVQVKTKKDRFVADLIECVGKYKKLLQDFEEQKDFLNENHDEKFDDFKQEVQTYETILQIEWERLLKSIVELITQEGLLREDIEEEKRKLKNASSTESKMRKFRARRKRAFPERRVRRHKYIF